jgi:CRISPR-associated endonuclease/helicase Cas3
MLVEAPMGEGKTEAAWLTHLLLRERLGHRGLYLALPTRATGNAMFTRVLDFLRSPVLRESVRRNVDFQLLHGSSSLNAEYKNLRLNGIHDNDDAGKNADADGGVRAGEWFTQKKRALLSEYGVGTVDQALLSILPVRHNFVRMWGLANRVVVLDEVHAYDTYTTKLIVTLVEWLVELGSSVILLSATVPPKFRRDIAACLGTTIPEPEKEYPRLTVFTKNSSARQIHFDANEEGRRGVRVERLGTDVPELSARLTNFPKGTALALVNTVDRAQKLYSSLSSGNGELLREEGFIVGKRLADGSEIYLFHSRFPADERQRREERILKEFGKNAGRDGRKILIATQVAEQSLDLDFDFMISDLAPTDLLLQRAGRLWRHKRGDRDAAEPVLAVSGLAGDAPSDFGKPLWWGAVYREDLLLLSWVQWRGLESVMLPDDIDRLVTAVYEKDTSAIPVPPEWEERYQKAEDEAEGEILAHGSLAAMAGVGHPDEFFALTESGIVFDDDDVLLGGSKKKAATRLGDMSATAIVLSADSDMTKNPEELYCRVLPITRKPIIVKLHARGVPREWSRSSLLRNAYPFTLNSDGFWTEDSSVRLDPELGLCYG